MTTVLCPSTANLTLPTVFKLTEIRPRNRQNGDLEQELRCRLSKGLERPENHGLGVALPKVLFAAQ